VLVVLDILSGALSADGQNVVVDVDIDAGGINSRQVHLGDVVVGIAIDIHRHQLGVAGCQLGELIEETIKTTERIDFNESHSVPPSDG